MHVLLYCLVLLDRLNFCISANILHYFFIISETYQALPCAANQYQLARSRLQLMNTKFGFVQINIWQNYKGAFNY